MSWLSVPLWPCGHKDRAYYLITVPVSFSRFSECLIVTLRTPLATAFSAFSTLGIFHRQPGADGRGHGFFDQVYVHGAGFERGVRLGRDFADERRLVVRVVQHAVFFEAKDQLRGGDPGGAECHGRSHAVGVAVEQRALSVVHDGAEDRGDARFEQASEQPGIDLLDVAHEAVVDRLGGAAAGRDGVAVGARHAERVAPFGLQ